MLSNNSQPIYIFLGGKLQHWKIYRERTLSRIFEAQVLVVYGSTQTRQRFPTQIAIYSFRPSLECVLLNNSCLSS